ncbi:MAG: hypothetical protein Q8S43_03955 [Actinomycetota bacterium]|nr:MAG: hypothetical protein FD171_823 [Actinomycetota bacterium]MDP3630091.1 hypothetical protein [Actinomycetota bacterium]
MRMSLVAAVGVPAAAYALRAALRGWDFSPDLPTDAILGVALVALVTLNWWIRRAVPSHDGDHDLPSEAHDTHDSEGDRRQ